MNLTPATPSPSAPPPPMQPELPYPMARRLREQGVSDAAIASELKRTGVAEEDVQFVINSLPGGTLARTPSRMSTDTSSAAGGELPLVGFAMLGLGIVITVGSFMSAAPGGTYVITWGLIVAGIVRIMRGR
jgi:hypothetical protein